MAWLRAHRLRWVIVGISLGIIGGCGGGHKPPGASSSPASLTLTPSGSVSLQLGSTLAFTASGPNPSSVTYASSDTSILNIAPNGVACAGHWDAAYANCTPGGIGVVQVTASALGATSTPTFVFVHLPIDNIVVKGVLLNGIVVQQPCLSQGQTMTVEAHAFSQGSDITASVGPFTWSANNSSVVSLAPLVNIAYNFPTNQATAKASAPGITQINATASGVTSTSFVQPPPRTDLTFFETCPIQDITLELGQAGSGQTSFLTSKGALPAVVATVTDVMGNSSLPNTNGGIVLKAIPLTWTSSQPQAVSASTGCTESCALSSASAGAAAVTATCAPPTCNIGFPEAPPGSIVPLPVYATTAISGVVTGASSSASVLATSLGCNSDPPDACTTSLYKVGTARATAGAQNPLPVSPNSLLFDLAGDKVYMGSDFGAQIIIPGNFGTTTSAFGALGTVTGKILAISTNGSQAVFSDTLHVPNQVYVVNTTSATPTVAALNIAGASAAGFSPDGLKTFIFGFDGNGNPNLYVYSALQALQTIPLALGTTVNSIAFSGNGAFTYVVEPSLGGGSPAVSVYNTCNNQPYTDTLTGAHEVPLTAPPIAFKALPDGVHFIALREDGNIDYISATITGIPPATLTSPSNTLCPMSVGHTIRTINLHLGTIHATGFFVSPDGTQLYVVASDRSGILVYNFSSGAVTSIELANNATPVSVDMTVDAGTILVAGSDGQLHQVSTALGGSDQVQIPFPNLPNFLNPFCNFTPASGACTLDFVAVQP